MKKHIKPLFHLAVGAVLAIMFAQQEDYQTYRNRELNLQKALESSTREDAIKYWAIFAQDPTDDRKKSNYEDALGKIERYRKGIALLDGEPNPPTMQEQVLNAQVKSQNPAWSIIPPYSKEKALALKDDPFWGSGNIEIAKRIAEEKEKEAQAGSAKEEEKSDKEKEEKEEKSDESKSDEDSKPATDTP